MPPASPSEPVAAPPGPADTPLDPAAPVTTAAATAATLAPDQLDATGRAEYLAQVMADIDTEVRRRRASGDLPAGLERQLDELFLEFSPVGAQGGAKLRESLALVDGSAYVDIAVPVASNKKAGVYIKRLLRKSMSWYIGFVVHQITKFAWAVARMFHLVVDRLEEMEGAIDSVRLPELPADAVPADTPGAGWWADPAVAALTGTRGRVLHAECRDGSLVGRLVEAGVDAYGVDPSEPAIEPAVDRGLDVRGEEVLDHLDVVGEEALAGLVLSGSVQWLHPNERDRLIALAVSRLGIDGTLLLHSATPEGWRRATPPLVADLAPGHPLHPDTWSHVLAGHGVVTTRVHFGGNDRRLDRVDAAHPDAATVNAAIDALNELVLGPSEYLLVAVRER